MRRNWVAAEQDTVRVIVGAQRKVGLVLWWACICAGGYIRRLASGNSVDDCKREEGREDEGEGMHLCS